jgi:hypothetical protein
MSAFTASSAYTSARYGEVSLNSCQACSQRGELLTGPQFPTLPSRSALLARVAFQDWPAFPNPSSPSSDTRQSDPQC